MVTAEEVGAFSRDQAEILSTRRGEPGWLRERRLHAQEVFAATPMPDTRPEEWRYTEIARVLDLDALEFAPESAPVKGINALPDPLRARIGEASEGAGRLVQCDASGVFAELSDQLAERGVVFTTLDRAVREHRELVEEWLGSALAPEAGKFAALNAAFWTGGVFVYVPEGVRVELPLRSWRWLSAGGTAVLPRTLVVAGAGAAVPLVEETVSADFGEQAASVGAVEVFAGEGAQVNHVAVQRWGRGVVQLSSDRFTAGRDAKITALNLALGSDLSRSDVRCRLEAPGAHADLLGLYLAEDTQHVDFQTLQDHVAPHASSNLLFKGALRDTGRSVFRGMIRVHKGAQRTDAYQTNRNLILSDGARADSLPNLEIEADDVRCSHAATVGQLDQEEIFYLRSRGIPEREAVRLVVFGFFGEVLDRLGLDGVRGELVRTIEEKLKARPGG
ncbi:MAG: Fe-S cluster assembly protein SufD [Longimicrobiaceae bacterium]